MTDREVLYFALGSLKSLNKNGQLNHAIKMIEDHLAKGEASA